eukprot:TRINITY_DN5219_c0_g1_i3.p1 TRINITY_DN5219_c0_g1~~TRINITY_DN5219_c0_g1_i3.p1  ORF type:complete len:626 (+),score=231.65 TRINITY_DN5219_c0_g1_i3:111-1988(+)
MEVGIQDSIEQVNWDDAKSYWRKTFEYIKSLEEERDSWKTKEMNCQSTIKELLQFCKLYPSDKTEKSEEEINLMIENECQLILRENASKFSKLQTEYDWLKMEYDQLETNFESRRQFVEDTKIRQYELEGMIGEKEYELEEMRKKEKKQEECLNDIMIKVNKLENSVKDAFKKTEIFDELTKKSQMSIEKLIFEKSSLEGQLKRECENSESLKKRFESIASDRDQFEDEKRELEKRIRELENQLQLEHKKMELMEENLIQKEKEKGDLLAITEKANSQVVLLEEGLQNWKKLLSQLQSKYEGVDSLISSKNEEIRILYNEVTEVKISKREQISELEMKLEGAIRQYNDVTDNWNRKFELERANQTNWEKENTISKQKISELEEQLKKLKDSTLYLDDENKQQKMNCATLERDLEDAKNMMKKSKEEMNSKEEKLVRDQIASEQKISLMELDQNRSMGMIEEQKEEISRLKSQNEELLKRLDLSSFQSSKKSSNDHIPSIETVFTHAAKVQKNLSLKSAKSPVISPNQEKIQSTEKQNSKGRKRADSLPVSSASLFKKPCPCGSNSNEVSLICKDCSNGFHSDCVPPNLIPKNKASFVCPNCKKPTPKKKRKMINKDNDELSFIDI